MPRPAAHRPLRPADARAVAHEVLVRVETTAAFADMLLARRLGSSDLPAADRGLATELVYGTLAWQGRLDHHLEKLLRGPIARLEPPVLVALRIGLYQLLFLDRVPAYAAVDASVRLAGAAGRGARGLVNAVLRRAAREGREVLALPDTTADAIARLAVEWSHPRWLVERLIDEIGLADVPALLAAHNRHGPVSLRPNPQRATRDDLVSALRREGVAVAPARWAPDALVVERAAGRLRALEAFRAGWFAFQGEPSQLVTRLLGLRPGARVLDACAAPGGKTCDAAQRAGPTGHVMALDVHRAGAQRILAESARLGLAHVSVLVADARQAPVREPFDAVLVDAPCTGLGTLRRHPELRWRRGPDDVARLARLQGQLLAGVAPLVRPGGILVYAVCSPLRAETDDVVASFLAATPRFAPEPAGPHLPGAAAGLVTPTGTLRTWPHRDDVDAFFAVRLRAS